MPSPLRQLQTAECTQRQLQCLASYYFDGLPKREIARMYRLNHETVRRHISRGLQRLRAVGLSPERRLLDAGSRIATLDKEGLDMLSARDVKAVW